MYVPLPHYLLHLTLSGSHFYNSCSFPTAIHCQPWGHMTSSVTWPLHLQYRAAYCYTWSSENMSLSRTVSEIWSVKVQPSTHPLTNQLQTHQRTTLAACADTAFSNSISAWNESATGNRIMSQKLSTFLFISNLYSIYTGWVKKVAPTTFDDIFAWAESFCIIFCTFIGNLCPHMSNDFCSFILTFNEMGVNFTTSTRHFYVFKFQLFSDQFTL